MTVTAVEDWTIPVIAAPLTAPRKGVRVMRSSQRLSLSPARARKAAVIVSIPNRKRPIPPRNPRMPPVMPGR